MTEVKENKSLLDKTTSDQQEHCDGCPFPDGTRCESAVPCEYNEKQHCLSDN